MILNLLQVSEKTLLRQKIVDLKKTQLEFWNLIQILNPLYII